MMKEDFDALAAEYPAEEIAEHVRTFRELLKAPGWALFCSMTAHHAINMAHAGHFDDEQPPGFYRGYLTACADLAAFPKAMVDKANREAEEAQRQDEIREYSRLRKPVPEHLREPMDDGARILRATFGGGGEDEEAHL